MSMILPTPHHRAVDKWTKELVDKGLTLYSMTKENLVIHRVSHEYMEKEGLPTDFDSFIKLERLFHRNKMSCLYSVHDEALYIYVDLSRCALNEQQRTRWEQLQPTKGTTQ